MSTFGHCHCRVFTTYPSATCNNSRVVAGEVQVRLLEAFFRLLLTCRAQPVRISATMIEKRCETHLSSATSLPLRTCPHWQISAIVLCDVLRQIIGVAAIWRVAVLYEAEAPARREYLRSARSTPRLRGIPRAALDACNIFRTAIGGTALDHGVLGEPTGVIESQLVLWMERLG